MKYIYKVLFFGSVFGMLISQYSCKKFLDEKADKKLIVPSTFIDLQALLDNYLLMNYQSNNLMEILADNYYVQDASYLPLHNYYKQNYVWAKYDETIFSAWPGPYERVNVANVVLDNLKQISYEQYDAKKANEIKGSALFYRAYYFYVVAQLFASPYDKKSASTDLGIPLRLDADFNILSKRSTIQETYDRIVADLKEAADLLPDVSTSKSRPSKSVVYAALARIYLVMQDFANAGSYADKSLSIKSQLLDFNDLDKNAPNPITQNNVEVIFDSFVEEGSLLLPSRCRIDSNLIRSYDQSDLRLKIFYRLNADGKTYRLKGNYSGAGSIGWYFSGYATNEMYLTRAECYARTGNTVAALDDLNKLMRNRWTAGKFAPFSASDPKQALRLILQERRKELVFTQTRWSDLRRLNKEPEFATTLKRFIGGKEYLLEPNDKAYAVQIPKEVIEKTGMPQNP